MTFRPPQNLSEGRDKRTLSTIESAVVAEKAISLGVAGRRLETALAALRGASPDEREARIDDAADRAWAYLVQRELCGLRDRTQAVADYAIPGEVMARLGAGKRKG